MDMDANFIVKNFYHGALCSEKNRILSVNSSSILSQTYIYFTRQADLPILLLSRSSHVRGTTGRVLRCEERELWQVRRQKVLRCSNTDMAEKRRITPILTIRLSGTTCWKQRKSKVAEKKKKKQKKERRKSHALLGLGKHPSMAPNHPESTSSAVALKPPNRRYRCFAAAHQRLESNTCKRMPLFRGSTSVFVGIQTTSKTRAQRPPAPPLPSQLRRGCGVFIASGSTLRQTGPFISFFIEVDVAMEHKSKDPEANEEDA